MPGLVGVLALDAEATALRALGIVVLGERIPVVPLVRVELGLGLGNPLRRATFIVSLDDGRRPAWLPSAKALQGNA